MKSTELLNQCVDIQDERGVDYDNGAERSFQKVATAFNAITGKDLKGSEVALMLQLLKDVRQWTHPQRLHEDSILDGVSYAALKGEELYAEQREREKLMCSTTMGIPNNAN